MQFGAAPSGFEVMQCDNYPVVPRISELNLGSYHE
jgi:hypothetical protein